MSSAPQPARGQPPAPAQTAAPRTKEEIQPKAVASLLGFDRLRRGLLQVSAASAAAAPVISCAASPAGHQKAHSRHRAVQLRPRLPAVRPSRLALVLRKRERLVGGTRRVGHPLAVDNRASWHRVDPVLGAGLRGKQAPPPHGASGSATAQRFYYASSARGGTGHHKGSAGKHKGSAAGGAMLPACRHGRRLTLGFPPFFSVSTMATASSGVRSS